jgi:hypothetical protein
LGFAEVLAVPAAAAFELAPGAVRPKTNAAIAVSARGRREHRRIELNRRKWRCMPHLVSRLVRSGVLYPNSRTRKPGMLIRAADSFMYAWT